jgi:Uma2 family endonuclease
MTNSFAFPRGREFTVRDLEDTPYDGNGYELIDGMLFVSPAPTLSHQVALGELTFLLHGARLGGMAVLPGPFAVRPDERTELRPDVVVGRRADFTETCLPVAPLLAVEVLAPSSVINDFNSKKAVYERMAVQSYWIFDPESPALTVFELDEDGQYQQIAEVVGEQAFEARQPFPVRIVPGEVLRGLTG